MSCIIEQHFINGMQCAQGCIQFVYIYTKNKSQNISFSVFNIHSNAFANTHKFMVLLLEKYESYVNLFIIHDRFNSSDIPSLNSNINTNTQPGCRPGSDSFGLRAVEQLMRRNFLNHYAI